MSMMMLNQLRYLSKRLKRHYCGNQHMLRSARLDLTPTWLDRFRFMRFTVRIQNLSVLSFFCGSPLTYILMWLLCRSLRLNLKLVMAAVEGDAAMKNKVLGYYDLTSSMIPREFLVWRKQQGASAPRNHALPVPGRPMVWRWMIPDESSTFNVYPVFVINSNLWN